jgi:hypothetical protein
MAASLESQPIHQIQLLFGRTLSQDTQHLSNLQFRESVHRE